MNNVGLTSGFNSTYRAPVSPKPNKTAKEDWAKLIESKRSELFADQGVKSAKSSEKTQEVKKTNNLWALNGYSKSQSKLNYTEETEIKADRNRRTLGTRLDLVV